MPEPIIDLGADVTSVAFKIGNQTISVFPLDELEAIHRLALPQNGPQAEHEAFWKICQDRLKVHGVAASLQMSGRWYDAVVKAHKEQVGFFEESPASSGSTEATQAGDQSTNSPAPNSECSNMSKTASKPKNSKKTSATKGKNTSRDGTR